MLMRFIEKLEDLGILQWLIFFMIVGFIIFALYAIFCSFLELWPSLF